MSNTFKKGVIFFISAAFLIITRAVFGLLKLSDNWMNWLFSIVYQILFMGVVPMVLYRVWLKKDTPTMLKELSLKPKTHPLSYLAAILIGFLTFYLTIIVSSYYNAVLSMFGYVSGNGVGTIFSSPMVLIMELLTTAMLPAIFEELVDRGLLYSCLDKVKSERKVIFIMALIFGLVHQNIGQFGYAVVGGYLFAYMLIKTRNIYLGMIVHFINNALSIMMQYGMQKGTWYGNLYERFFGLFVTNGLLILLSGFLCFAIIKMIINLLGRLNQKNVGVSTDSTSSKYIEQNYFGISNTSSSPRINNYKEILAKYSDVTSSIGDVDYNYPVANNLMSEQIAKEIETQIQSTQKEEEPFSMDYNQFIEIQKNVKLSLNKKPSEHLGGIYATIAMTSIITILGLIAGMMR